MRSKSTWVLTLALLGAIILSVAACGGSSKSASPPPPPPPAPAPTPPPPPPAPTPPPPPPAPTPPPPPSPTPPPATSTSEAKLPSGECRDLAEAASKIASAASSTSATDIDKTTKLLDDLADKAPSSIKDDFKLIADAFSKIAPVVKDVKPGQQPTPDQLAKLQELQTQIDATKLTQASAHIEAWITQHCGTG